jgi:uncharacterized protein (DUF58 family)
MAQTETMERNQAGAMPERDVGGKEPPQQKRRGARKAAKAAKVHKAHKVRKRQLRSDEEREARRTRHRKQICCIGLILICLALALVVGTDEYRASAIGWLPLIIVLAGIGTAWIYLKILKRGFRFLEKNDLGDVQRGADVNFTVRFKNATLLFAFRIEAYFFVSDLFGNTSSENMTTVALSPFENYDMDFKVRFEHIGKYNAGVRKIVLTDFLRLFTTTLTNPAMRKVEVTPRIVPIQKIELSNEAVVETLKATKAALADSLDYAYVRNYVPGDPLKTIHWKLSARGENYLTRLYEVYSNPGVAIITDFYAPDNSTHQMMGMFDTVVETTFSVARYCQVQGMETEVHYVNRFGEKVRRLSWQRNELPGIVEEIPAIANDKLLAVQALDLINGQVQSQYGQNNLVIVSANLSAQMISTVIEAKARHREPRLFAVIPNDLVGREREDYTASLGRLDAAGIGYLILSRSEELTGVKR